MARDATDVSSTGIIIRTDAGSEEARFEGHLLYIITPKTSSHVS